MAIPETQELMLPILQLLTDENDYRIRDLVAKLAEELDLSEDDLRELTPGGSQAKFYSRVTGARSYLTNAKLLDSPKRGVSRITKMGHEIAANPPEDFNLNFLTSIPEFVEYLRTSRSAAKDPELRALLKALEMEEAEKKAEAEVEKEEEVTEEAGSFVTEKQLLGVISGLSALNPQTAQPEVKKEEEVKVNKIFLPTARKRNPDAFKKQPVNVTLMALFRIMENYFQHRWIYLSPLLIMAISCAVYFILEKPNYVSEGIISVQSDTLIENVAGIGDDGFNWVTPAQATTDEFSELLQTDAFIRLIIQQTPLEASMDDGEQAIEETILDAREAIWVVPLGSNQVKLNAEYRVADVAHNLAEGAVNTFIQWQIDSAKQDSISARVFLENLIPEYEADYNAAIEALEGYLLQNPEPLRGNRPALEQLQIDRLQTEVGQAYDRYITAQENLEQIRLQEVIAEGTTRQTYTIVDYPLKPRTPEIYFVDVVTVVAIFVAVGVTLTAIGVIGSTALDRSIRLPIDARYVTDLTVLGVIPAPPAEKRARRRRRKAEAEQPVGQKEEDPKLAVTS